MKNELEIELIWVGNSTHHSMFTSHGKDQEFEDCKFMDIPIQQWIDLGKPIRVKVTIEPIE